MKNDLNENIDEKIKQFFVDETENISIPDNSFYKIKSGILREEERGFLNMKFRFLKMKTVIAAGLIIATVGTVGVAASTGKLSWIGASDTRAEITEFPKEKVVEKRVGFSPKYVDSFSNGFKFSSFSSSHSDLKDDNKDVITNVKSADFKYKRDGSAKNQDLTFSAKKVEEQYAESNNLSDNPTEYNGVKIHYYSNKYKDVPADYKVTEEEQKMIDQGTLQVGYGADEVSEDNDQIVSWYQDGVEYVVMNSNYDDLTKEQMIEMAKQVIDK